MNRLYLTSETQAPQVLLGRVYRPSDPMELLEDRRCRVMKVP
jgi:hypothetical protein